MMKSNKAYFIVSMISIVLTVGGCSSGTNVEVKHVKRIRKGVTTEKQVRQMLGEPTSVDINYKRGRKTLGYAYTNTDSTNQVLVGAGTAIATVALGPVGLIGGYLASNNVQSRVERKQLNVVISLRTHRVIDYNYTVNQGRTSGIGLGGSIGSL